jgi:hypothetical protein
MLDKIDGEPVEQLDVGGGIALAAEVAGRGDDAPAEVVLPQAINQDARRERMIWLREPARQCCPAARCFAPAFTLQIGRSSRQELWKPRLHLAARLIPIAAC